MIEIRKALEDAFDEPAKVLTILGILKLLAYQRVLNPGGKLYTHHSQSELWGNWAIDENRMYRSLKDLALAKENMQIRAHNGIKNTIGRDATLVFYDVTNCYFEIDFDDEYMIEKETGEIDEGLRKRGVCKSNSKKPIVQLGLFMDTNGIPIS
jgi:hypothetical protein